MFVCSVNSFNILRFTLDFSFRSTLKKIVKKAKESIIECAVIKPEAFKYGFLLGELEGERDYLLEND